MVFFKDNSKSIQEISMCQASVKGCFVLADFNEELPLYLLQLQNETTLVLFGQWLYDPHVLITPEDVFEQWQNESFFSEFLLRYDAETGKVFELRVESSSFIPAKRLPKMLRFTHLRECEFIKGPSKDLIRDLQRGGLIKLANNGGVL